MILLLISLYVTKHENFINIGKLFSALSHSLFKRITICCFFLTCCSRRALLPLKLVDIQSLLSRDYTLVGIPSPQNLRRLTLSSAFPIGHWWFVLIVGWKLSLTKSLKFSCKVGIPKMLYRIILDLRDLNLIPVKYLNLLNAQYMWSFRGLVLPVRYSLSKFLCGLCVVCTLLWLELFSSPDLFSCLPKRMS